MDENVAYEEYESERLNNEFPAYRYWKNGVVVGDNLDVFFEVQFGNAEIVGTYPEEELWVVTIEQEGSLREVSYKLNEYEVVDGEEPPYSELPEEYIEEYETSMGEAPDIVPEELPTDGEVGMVPDESEEIVVDDSEDVQVDNGDNGIEILPEPEPESAGSIEDLPEETTP